METAIQNKVPAGVSKLILSVSPHISDHVSTRKIMLDVIIALIPALAASCIIFGLRSLLLTAVSAAACMLTEHVWCRLVKKPSTIGDLSAIVTGILLAYNVTPALPVWQLIVGDVAAIAVVKMLFGGIGCNFVNPALIGRIVIAFSFTQNMTTYSYPSNGIDALASATPLAVSNHLASSDFLTLFLGNHGGVLGETCALALILGGMYLVIRKVIKPIIPLAFIGSTLLFTWAFGGNAPFLAIFAGGLMLGAFFMATDYVTTPYTELGKAVFGIGCGLLTAAIRTFANSAEGVSFAILLMNLAVPYINDATRRKPLGWRKA